MALLLGSSVAFFFFFAPWEHNNQLLHSNNDDDSQVGIWDQLAYAPTPGDFDRDRTPSSVFAFSHYRIPSRTFYPVAPVSELVGRVS